VTGPFLCFQEDMFKTGWKMNGWKIKTV